MLSRSCREQFFNVDFQLDKLQILFLKLDEPPSSIVNFTILCLKYFIWRAKFSESDLNLPIFLRYLFLKLKDLKEAKIYCNKEYEFNKWNAIFDILSRTRPDNEQHLVPELE